MSRIDAWLGNSTPLAPWLDDHDQAVDEAIIISDKTTSIVVVRGATTLSAQTVRIEGLNGNRQVQSSAGQVFQVDSIVFGYKSHPTITATDLKPGDTFAANGVLYQVIMLVPGLVDSLQAYCQVVG